MACATDDIRQYELFLHNHFQDYAIYIAQTSAFQSQADWKINLVSKQKLKYDSRLTNRR